MTTITIKFSHRYFKMPANTDNTLLLAVFKTNYSKLGQTFIKYDTEYSEGQYPLPQTELLILLLMSKQPDEKLEIWTTMRRWTPTKEYYYMHSIGSDVKIEVQT